MQKHVTDQASADECVVEWPSMFALRLVNICKLYLGFDGLHVCDLHNFMKGECWQHVGARTRHSDGVHGYSTSGPCRRSSVHMFSIHPVWPEVTSLHCPNPSIAKRMHGRHSTHAL